MRLAADMSGGGDNKTHGMRQDNGTEADIYDEAKKEKDRQYRAKVKECEDYIKYGGRDPVKNITCAMELKELLDKPLEYFIKK